MTKIEALKKTIYNLENSVYEYSWGYMDSCNCGVLARTILGGRLPSKCGLSSVKAVVKKGAFSMYASCMTTNLPLPLVFKSLKDAGFTHKELYELEYLMNPEILKTLKIATYSDHFHNCNIPSSNGYQNKKNLIKYLKAWVEILEEKLNSEPLVQECDARKDDSSTKAGSIKIKYVGVPVSIGESLPETILS